MEGRGGKRDRLFYGWTVVAIAFVSMALTYGVRYIYPAFFIALEEEFGWTRTQTYGSFSLKMFVYAFAAPLAGALFDRLGPRKLFPAASLVVALGLVGCSQLSALWHLYLFGGVLIPLGMVCLGVAPHNALISHWFVKNRALRTRRFWFFFATLFFLMVGVYGVMMHEVAYAVDLGFSKTTAAAAFGLTLLLGAVAKILWGGLGDRIGREPIYSVIMSLASVAIVLLLWLQDSSQVWLLYGAAALYGLGYGAIVPILGPVCADLFQGRSLRTIYGFALIAGGSGGALGPLLSAYIFDTTGGYTPRPSWWTWWPSTSPAP